MVNSKSIHPKAVAVHLDFVQPPGDPGSSLCLPGMTGGEGAIIRRAVVAVP